MLKFGGRWVICFNGIFSDPIILLLQLRARRNFQVNEHKNQDSKSVTERELRSSMAFDSDSSLKHGSSLQNRKVLTHTLALSGLHNRSGSNWVRRKTLGYVTRKAVIYGVSLATSHHGNSTDPGNRDLHPV